MSIGLRTDRYIDLTGIRDHTVRELNIVEGVCVSKSTTGNTILHFPEEARMADGRTILSPLQMEHHGCKIVDIAPEMNGGKQPYLVSPDGYVFPLSIRQGLPILDIRPVLDSEWDTLPHTYMTSDAEWDPSKFDSEVTAEW